MTLSPEEALVTVSLPREGTVTACDITCAAVGRVVRRGHWAKSPSQAQELHGTEPAGRPCGTCSQRVGSVQPWGGCLRPLFHLACTLPSQVLGAAPYSTASRKMQSWQTLDPVNSAPHRGPPCLLPVRLPVALSQLSCSLLSSTPNTCGCTETPGPTTELDTVVKFTVLTLSTRGHQTRLCLRGC